jgi:predicted DNA-binding transcriptional regulator YafY
MRANRLLSILLTLQLRGRVTARELAERFEVSRRTIFRDVEELSAAGVPIYADRGVGGGFALVEGFRTELTGFTSAETEALLLAGLPGAAADLGMSEAASLGRLKLLSALPGPARELARRVADRFHLDPVDWYRRTSPPPHLRTVAAAVWEARRIRVRYESWTKTARRTLDPLGLILKAGEWYVLARAAKRIGIYRVSKFLEVQLLAEEFKRPEIEIAKVWADEVRRFEASLRVGTATIRASPRALSRLYRLGADMSEPLLAATPDGEGFRQAEVPIEGVAHAASLLLGLGDDIEVLGPVKLRDDLARRAERVAAMYRA